MTKVQLRFDLLKPLTEELLEKISWLHSVYGILKVSFPPDMNKLIVEYDASRLSPMEVENVLHRAGLPIVLNA